MLTEFALPDEQIAKCKNKYDVIRQLFWEGKCRLCTAPCTETINWESNGDKHMKHYHEQFFVELLLKWDVLSPYASRAEAKRQKRSVSASRPVSEEPARMTEIQFQQKVLLFCTSSNDAFRVVENQHFKRICSMLPYNFRPHGANYYSQQMLPLTGEQLTMNAVEKAVVKIRNSSVLRAKFMSAQNSEKQL